MGVFSRLRCKNSSKARAATAATTSSSSSICCSRSEVGSLCSSLRQDVGDSQQQQSLPVPSHALDQWSFPSSRSGLRSSNNNSSSSKLFSRFVNHGAAFPADETVAPNRCSSGTGASSHLRPDALSLQLQQHRAATRCPNSAAAVCCCCSDSSTHSGASNELCRARWCSNSSPGAAAALQQQQRGGGELQEKQQQQALGMVLNVPTLIECRGVKCLILDAPRNENLQAYLAAMRSVGVTDLVRTCAPTYDDKLVIAAGIRVHELTFPDGDAPPAEVISKWRALAAAVKAEGGLLAVHCVAGLGRGPVLVAISLIDSGMGPEEAVLFIRSRRKGAINRRQLAFLHSYRRSTAASRRCMRGCTIM
ncbi:hypothetical protein Efla_002540 [Eimeria flavescens]